MVETLLLNSWVSVSDGCALRGSVTHADVVQFTFGTGLTEFEFSFDAATLRRFIPMAAQALREMEHWQALDERGKDVSEEAIELVAGGEAAS